MKIEIQRENKTALAPNNKESPIQTNIDHKITKKENELTIYFLISLSRSSSDISATCKIEL